MQIVEVKISDLKPSEYNPRKLTKDQHAQLSESIRKFGLVDPIIVNKHAGRENVVIGGHQRLKIASDLNYTEVPVVFLDLDENAERELNLRLNKNLGEWDWDMLANQFDTSLLKEIGFTNNELGFMQGEGEEDNFDADAEVAKITTPESKAGEVYELGRHRLMCGDSSKEEDVGKLFNGEVAKIVFTSPPYNMGGGMYEMYQDNLKSAEYIDFNLKVAKCWTKYLKGYLFWNVSYNKNARWEFLEILYRMTKEIGLRFLELIVWDKGHGMPIVSQDMLTRQYEDIMMLADEETIQGELSLYWVAMTEKRGWFNKIKGKGITNLWKVGTNRTQLENHLACFPVKLPAKAINLTTEVGDIVADPFGGSGSTLLACEQLDRRCFTMELDPKYCDVIRKRYKQYVERGIQG